MGEGRKSHSAGANRRSRPRVRRRLAVPAGWDDEVAVDPAGPADFSRGSRPLEPAQRRDDAVWRRPHRERPRERDHDAIDGQSGIPGIGRHRSATPDIAGPCLVYRSPPPQQLGYRILRNRLLVADRETFRRDRRDASGAALRVRTAAHHRSRYPHGDRRDAGRGIFPHHGNHRERRPAVRIESCAGGLAADGGDRAVYVDRDIEDALTGRSRVLRATYERGKWTIRVFDNRSWSAKCLGSTYSQRTPSAAGAQASAPKPKRNAAAFNPNRSPDGVTARRCQARIPKVWPLRVQLSR